MKASDVMVTNVITVSPETSVQDAARILLASRIMADRLGACLAGLVFAVDFTKPATLYGSATNDDIAEAREHSDGQADEAAATFDHH